MPGSIATQLISTIGTIQAGHAKDSETTLKQSGKNGPNHENERNFDSFVAGRERFAVQ